MFGGLGHRGGLKEQKAGQERVQHAEHVLERLSRDGLVLVHPLDAPPVVDQRRLVARNCCHEVERPGGKYADLIVLDQNLFKVPVQNVDQTKVLETIFNGKVVYRK